MFFFRPTYLLTIFVIAAALLPAAITALEVKVDTKKAGSGPSVTKAHKYSAHVTLYIEDEDGSRTPSGWSTEGGRGRGRPAIRVSAGGEPHRGMVRGGAPDGRGGEG